MEQTKPPQRAKIDLEKSSALVFEKARDYNESLPKHQKGKGIKEQHAHTMCRMIKLLTIPGNISPMARVLGGVPWVTLKTHGWALGKQMLHRSRGTIDGHFKRLKDAGFIEISTPLEAGKAIRSATTSCLVSISPDVIAYR